MPNNRHGLSRTIPTEVRREIRRRSKFGCVICRCAVYQYEHIDPPFAEASAHDPAKMCLLCGRCHDQVTRGRVSKQTVLRRYLEVQNSEAVGRPFEALDLYSSRIDVHIGSAIFEQPRTILEINGEAILSISPAHDGEAFPSLNGVFYDTRQREILRIDDNVWFAQNTAWDVQVTGTSLAILVDGNRVALRMELSPPNLVRLVELDLYKDNCHVLVRDGQLLVGHIGAHTASYLGLADFRCLAPTTAIRMDSRGISSLAPSSIAMVGGKGISFNGTGICIGDGAPGMYIQQLRYWLC